MLQQAYRAKWLIFPQLGAIENAALIVKPPRIVFVGRLADAPSAEFTDLGDVAILPGFVNAHVHMDLAPLQSQPSQLGFVPWLQAVVAQRRNSNPDTVVQTIRKNVAAIIASGTTLVADIATSDHSEKLLRYAGIKAVVYREVLGRKPARFEPLIQWAKRRPSNLVSSRYQQIIHGYSPHAPFSTAVSVYEQLGHNQARSATHWRETAEELEFLQNGTGPISDFLESLGALEEYSGKRPTFESLERRLLRSSENCLVVHGNYLDDAAVKHLSSPAIRKRIAAVVYCPRTHAYFGHPPHPWKKIEAAGIPVMFGTDSLASNPDLSVFNEAKFLWQTDPAIHPSALLQALTNGRPLNFGPDAKGRSRADIAIVKGMFTKSNKPLEHLFDADAKVLGTMADGRWLRSPHAPS